MRIQHELIQQLASILIASHKKIVTAESCTGGMLATIFTDIPGCSQWFECGLVTYSNQAKTKLLGVSAQLLAQHGAVSNEVAGAMAQGALAASRADLSIAITGIAGPAGGSVDKPVGTVCFAWGMKDKVMTRRIEILSIDRHGIRVEACCEAMKGAIEMLREG